MNIGPDTNGPRISHQRLPWRTRGDVLPHYLAAIVQTLSHSVISFSPLNKWIVVALLLPRERDRVCRSHEPVCRARLGGFQEFLPIDKCPARRPELGVFLELRLSADTDRSVGGPYGVKYPMAISFLLWSLVSAGTGWATTSVAAFAFRILLGIGEAIITPGSLRWIRFNIDEKQRGLAIGLFFAGAKLGPAIGSVAAVWLLKAYGWRMMFTILGIGSLLWLIPWLLSVKNDDRQIESEALASRQMPPSVVRIGIQDTGDLRHHHRHVRLQLLQLFLPDVDAGVLRRALASHDGRHGYLHRFSFAGMAVVAILAGFAGTGSLRNGWNPIKVRKGFTIAGLAIASTEVIGVMSGSRDVRSDFAIISLAGLGLTTANYWALTQILMPGAAIGRIAGVQNFASNLSGIVAPIVTGRLIEMTGSYEAPMQAILVLLAFGIAAYVFLVRPKYAPQAAQAAT